MKLSMLWLQEWVNFALTEQELADQLTMAGLEVNALSPVAGAFTKVLTAQVLNTKQHPNADKLSLCEVKVDENTVLKVVCGASNVRPGLKVALAMVGATLPGGLKIKEAPLRGELSQGMLCSMSELGLAEQSDGIMELDEDAPLGMDLGQYLSLNDHILDIDLTPNRADCFSVLGIARELAVLNALPLKESPIPKISPSIDDTLNVLVKEPAACPRYCGRVIRNINPGAITPLWMRERLRRSGLRLIHPIVDIMNYVMLELGQPMHAFDLNKITGGIQVRFSSISEQLRLLDGQQITLDDKTLVIADDEKPLALAGIMGGAESAVVAETRDIFLESAFFNPKNISGLARKYNTFSDSSQRYERGVDPKLQLRALERATELIQDIAGGSIGPIMEVSELKHLPKEPTINFQTSKVLALTGLDIAVSRMQELLEGLGMKVNILSEALFEVSVPSHRFDIQLDVDLVEEIIRLYGYDKLQPQPMMNLMEPGKTSPIQLMNTRLSNWFKDKGYHETISYSFVDPEIQEALYPGKESMQLLNPISSELSQMRVGMWPGLLASMVYNVHRQQNTLKLFETGVVFNVVNKELQEQPCIAGLMMGTCGSMNWSQPTRLYDFYDLKGDLEALFTELKLKSVAFSASAHPALHPGKSAAIEIAGKHLGWIGVLHPRYNDYLNVNQEVMLFELSTQALITTDQPKYKVISKYPQIRRDLSFLVDEEVTAQQIEQAVRATITEDWLKAFDIFDVYNGSGIPAGKKSIAIAMTLQDDKRTLVDAEINSLISAILTTLETNFSIILRD